MGNEKQVSINDGSLKYDSDMLGMCELMYSKRIGRGSSENVSKK